MTAHHLERPLPSESVAAAFLADQNERVTDLVQSHHHFIWRLLRRLGVRESNVDDAAQQVFCVAARRLGDIAPGSERSFLFGTALRVAADSERAHHRHEQLTEALDDNAGSFPSPEEALEARRRRELLDEVLSALPLELRTVLVLFELEQLGKREIAELLAIPEGTAMSRLRRARLEFKACAKRILLRAAHGKVSP